MALLSKVLAAQLQGAEFRSQSVEQVKHSTNASNYSSKGFRDLMPYSGLVDCSCVCPHTNIYAHK